MSTPVVLQKVVFPSTADPDVAPLYVDPDEWTDMLTSTRPDAHAVKHRRGVIPDDVEANPLRLTHHNVAPMLDRLPVQRSRRHPDGRLTAGR